MESKPNGPQAQALSHAPHLSLVEAVENLSYLADMAIPISPSEIPGLSPEEQAVVQETFHHLSSSGGNPIEAVRETFDTLLQHVTTFYRRQYSQLSNPKVRSNFRSLMAMVGEAGRKLDRCTGIFQQAYRVSDLAEYRALEDFFQQKLAKPIGESPEQNLDQLAKRTLEDGEGNFISLHARAAEDLQRLIDDSEYELFFLKKEDGTSFFTPQLMRNLKVIHQLGKNLPEAVESDPLIELRELLDLEAHQRCRQLLRAVEHEWKDLLPIASQPLKPEWSDLLAKSMMALMLGANSRNLLAALPPKNSLDYFKDFLGFLVEVIASPAYQSSRGGPLLQNEEAILVSIVHGLCRDLFLFPTGHTLLEPLIQKLIKASLPEGSQQTDICLRLLDEDQAIRKSLSRYPSGPLLRMLDFVTASDIPEFYEPLLQENFPGKLWTYEGPGFQSDMLRIPSPTRQDHVHRVYPSRLFEGFLDSYLLPTHTERHLLIQLQDRTSWRDYPRAHALEELPRMAEYLPHLTVVTLSMHTDFYHQVAPFDAAEMETTSFLKMLKEQLLDGESYGFYFPPGLRSHLQEKVESVLSQVHEQLFDKRRQLTRDERLIFIELFYVFLSRNLLETLKPTSFSFTDKDGVDQGACQTTLFYMADCLEKDPNWRPANETLLHAMLFAPALIIRERAPHRAPVGRFLQAAHYLHTRSILPIEPLGEAQRASS